MPRITVPLYEYVTTFRCSTLDGSFLNWRRLGDGLDYACPIQYNAEYRQVETQGKGESASDSISENSDSEDNHILVPGITSNFSEKAWMTGV
jgi:hypothetical protein